MTSHRIDWDNTARWGDPATCIHYAAWCADGKHDDNAGDDQ